MAVRLSELFLRMDSLSTASTPFPACSCTLPYFFIADQAVSTTYIDYIRSSTPSQQSRMKSYFPVRRNLRISASAEITPLIPPNYGSLA